MRGSAPVFLVAISIATYAVYVQSAAIAVRHCTDVDVRSELERKEAKSSDVVKMAISAKKPAADGRQVVLVALNIAPSWFIFGNPVDNEAMKHVETVIRIKPNAQVRDVKIEYPLGKIKEPVPGFKCRTYERDVTISITFIRNDSGDKTDLEIFADVAACSAIRPLRPSQLKGIVTLHNP